MFVAVIYGYSAGAKGGQRPWPGSLGQPCSTDSTLPPWQSCKVGVRHSSKHNKRCFTSRSNTLGTGACLAGLD